MVSTSSVASLVSGLREHLTGGFAPVFSVRAYRTILDNRGRIRLRMHLARLPIYIPNSISQPRRSVERDFHADPPPGASNQPDETGCVGITLRHRFVDSEVREERAMLASNRERRSISVMSVVIKRMKPPPVRRQSALVL